MKHQPAAAEQTLSTLKRQTTLRRTPHDQTNRRIEPGGALLSRTPPRLTADKPNRTQPTRTALQPATGELPPSATPDYYRVMKLPPGAPHSPNAMKREPRLLRPQEQQTGQAAKARTQQGPRCS